MAENTENPAEEALKLNEAAWKQHEAGKHAEALQNYERALPLWEAAGEKGRLAACLFDMSYLVQPPHNREMVTRARDLWAELDAGEDVKRAEARLAEIEDGDGDDEKDKAKDSGEKSASAAQDGQDDAEKDTRSAATSKKDAKDADDDKKSATSARKGDDKAESAPIREPDTDTDDESGGKQGAKSRGGSSARATPATTPGGPAAALAAGLAAYYAGKHDDALAHFAAAYQAARLHKDPARAATALNNMGAAQRASGDDEAARQSYEAALKAWSGLGDPAGEAATCHNLALVLHAGLGRSAEAVRYMTRCVTLERQVNHPALADDTKKLDEIKRAAG